MPKIIEKIKKDIEKYANIEDIYSLDELALHFGVCLYIRNHYLYNKKRNLAILSKYFKTDNVDTISRKVIDEFKKIDNKNHTSLT